MCLDTFCSLLYFSLYTFFYLFLFVLHGWMDGWIINGWLVDQFGLLDGMGGVLLYLYLAGFYLDTLPAVQGVINGIAWLFGLSSLSLL